MFTKDTIYTDNTDVTKVVDFDFDKKIAKVFPDMVHRSIPGYASLLTVMQAIFRAEFANSEELLIYDLGCSVGGVTLALANVLPVQTHFIGVDVSADMLAQYNKAIRLSHINERVTSVQQSIVDLDINPCQAITINFTLQFLDPSDRQHVLNNCYNALGENGLLFIAEKTHINNDITLWHEQFKLNNGYSELEIAKKRKAIEKVMRIDNEETITKRCQQAGFREITQVFHALGFKAWVIKK